MIQALATILGVDSYHIQCLLPVTGFFTAGALGYLYGFLRDGGCYDAAIS